MSLRDPSDVECRSDNSLDYPKVEHLPSVPRPYEQIRAMMKDVPLFRSPFVGPSMRLVDHEWSLDGGCPVSTFV